MGKSVGNQEPGEDRGGTASQQLTLKGFFLFMVVVVQSPTRVQLSVTPWTAVRLLCPPLSPRVFSNSCP